MRANAAAGPARYRKGNKIGRILRESSGRRTVIYFSSFRAATGPKIDNAGRFWFTLVYFALRCDVYRYSSKTLHVHSYARVRSGISIVHLAFETIRPPPPYLLFIRRPGFRSLTTLTPNSAC